MWQAIILDDVVQAFSPWVQQLYLVRGKKTLDAELRDAEMHLLPLYYFLQRGLCLKAIMISTAMTASSLSDETTNETWRSASVDRCRVGFPTILETISTVDKLDPSVAPRMPGRHRLRRIVEAISSTISLKTVQDALATGQRSSSSTNLVTLERSPARTSPLRTPGTTSPLGSPSGESHFPEFPPEGAEDECSLADSVEEYFSVADSDEDNMRRFVPRRNASARSTSSAESNTGGGFQARLAAFPRGKTDECWDSYDASNFPVRSLAYLKDGVKLPSQKVLSELVNLDVVRVSEDGPIRQVSDHPDFYPAFHRRSGDPRFLLVINIFLGQFQAVVCGAIDSSALALSPKARDLWYRFLTMPVEEQRARFKLIASIEEGPWLVRNLLPNTKKPVIIAKTVQMDSYYTPTSHLELVLDVAHGKGWDMAVGVVLKQAKKVVITLAFLIEGLNEEELPETMLISAWASRMDTARFVTPC